MGKIINKGITETPVATTDGTNATLIVETFEEILGEDESRQFNKVRVKLLDGSILDPNKPVDFAELCERLPEHFKPANDGWSGE